MLFVRSGLDLRGTVVRLPAHAPDFPLVQIVIPAQGPARPFIQSISVDGWGVGVKWLGREFDQSLKSSTEEKSEWSCTSIPPLLP